MANLKGAERRLSKDLERTEAYRHEIQKLIQGGYVAKIKPNGLTEEGESWYVPHHMVSHNGQNRIVFNCSFQYQGLNLSLLPGPTLGVSLLGVLLRFREHAVAISGDIKGMFHQVRLLPQDRPLIRFVWRDMKREEPPEVYEWQVLPFGTTCSPCCATFALQHHVTDHSKPGDKVRFSVERCFYVDNCLQSLPTPEEAKQLVDDLRETLASGGFDLRQWASNQTSVVSHLPKEARSDSTELWLAEDKSSSPESTLGLSWHPQPDTLGYKHRPVSYRVPTMRNIYKVLASQYDPLGFILPFTTRAKMLVRHLWDKQRDWDDPLLPKELLQAWTDWEEELHDLKDITMPRAYVPDELDQSSTSREIHVFSDASEQAYGSVAYLRTETSQVGVMPVGIRVAEIQELTNLKVWHYVDSASNPADDITRGKTLKDLAEPNRWSQGPPFLLHNPDKWPVKPTTAKEEDASELRKSVFCGVSSVVSGPAAPEASQHETWKELLEATAETLHGAAGPSGERISQAYHDAETLIIRKAQQDSFPDELRLLKAGKPIPSNSRLLTLSSELDKTNDLIRVGGRLRRAEELDQAAVYPVVMDPGHATTKLVIQDYDQRLCHPGPERVFAEIRRTYWILRGREAVRRYQHTCTECQRWKARPNVPKMADLPPARLRLFRPAFYSTGMDCFGPFMVKVGRRTEKRWGIIFKCLTTRAVHLDFSQVSTRTPSSWP
ncbi:hypothetical protein DPEC_G00004680 [Dallia pectoralis]|uniref:Uncharacterized protein n=1 Tax=Dallia pectoralis TaxID=75939 RepID=A0ACC2HJK0_DALPE|nr:hypothetical protein DPEC_G00004680 [Dallia pectoralis]